MPKFTVEYVLTYRTAVEAPTARAAEEQVHEAALKAQVPVRINFSVREDLMAATFADPDKPVPPFRGKPTPGGGRTPGGIVRVPVLQDQVAKVA